MKKRIILSLSLMLATVLASAQYTKSLRLTADDGTDVLFGLSRSLRLTFSDNQLVADDGSQRVEISLDQVHLAYSTEGSTAIEAPAVPDGRPVVVRDGVLLFQGLAPGQPVRIYTADGRLLRTIGPAEGTATLSLDDLPRGVSIVRAGQFTMKYQRR